MERFWILDFGFWIRGWGLGARDWALRTRGWGLGTRGLGLGNRGWGLGTREGAFLDFRFWILKFGILNFGSPSALCQLLTPYRLVPYTLCSLPTAFAFYFVPSAYRLWFPAFRVLPPACRPSPAPSP
jgi:hypothetical protein